MPRSSDLRRRRARRSPFPRFLIVCEGEKTEPGYFRHLRISAKIPIDLHLEGPGKPKSLVEKAVELKREAEKRAHSQRDSTLLFDEVWCVFDIDEHPFVPEARQQAQDNQIFVAVSNPCFELWVLLHFEDQRKHIGRHAVQSRCRQHLPGYNKDLPCDKLMPGREEALRRAEDLWKWQEGRGNVGGNPSTDVYRLVRKLLSLRAAG